MLRTTLVLLAMSSAQAWAVGERIVLPVSSAPFADQLHETLCIPRECVGKGGPIDATLTAKLKGKNGVLEVIAPNGEVKARVTAPATEGRIGSMDLVAATSAL